MDGPLVTHADGEVAADFRLRLDRVQAAMRERGLGGLVLYSSGQHSMLRMDEVHYLSDFRGIGVHTVLLVPPSGEPTLLLTPPWEIHRAREAVWFESVEAVDPAELTGLVARHAGRLPGPVGLSGRRTMPLGFARELEEAHGRPFVDAPDLVPGLARTRTPVELERVRRASTIADIGFQALFDAVRVGVREYELSAEIDAAMNAAGAEDNFGLLASGSHILAIRSPVDRPLELGDLVVGEITPCYRGSFAQLCRTVVVGEPNPVVREKFDLLIRALHAGFAATRPGLPSAGITSAMNSVIGAAGYAEYCRQPYMRTRGHGLGFGGVVPSDLTEQSRPTLQEEMTFVIHPNQYLPETGYMMVGDTVVVRADGPERLTQTPIELFWKHA